MRTFKHLETEIKETALYLQNTVKTVESIHRFTFAIEVEGRTDGDLKITYRIGTDYDSTTAAGTIAAALTEALRRRGWQEANAPICISHVTSEEVV